jgi:hypothetical protein
MFIDEDGWFDQTEDEKWQDRVETKMETYSEEFIQGCTNVCFSDELIAHFFAIAWFEGDELARAKATELGFQDIEFYAYLGMKDEFCEELIELENDRDSDYE